MKQREQEIQGRLSDRNSENWRVLTHRSNSYWTCIAAKRGDAERMRIVVEHAATCDAAFIANAPADIEYLLTELKKARDEIASLKKKLQHAREYTDFLEGGGRNDSVS